MDGSVQPMTFDELVQKIRLLSKVVKQLQADSARYQFLKRQYPIMLAGIAWGASERAADFGPRELDQAIDAAIEEERMNDAEEGNGSSAEQARPDVEEQG